MKPFEFHPDARMELREAAHYYEQESPGRGDHFLAAVDDALDTFQMWPEVGSPDDLPGYRRYNVRGYPYIIYYMPMEDWVWVACVKHASRRPDYWIHRRPS